MVTEHLSCIHLSFRTETMTFIFRLWPAIEDGRLDHATVWTKELSDLLLRGTFSHVPDGDLVSGFHHEHDRGDPHGLWR